MRSYRTGRGAGVDGEDEEDPARPGRGLLSETASTAFAIWDGCGSLRRDETG